MHVTMMLCDHAAVADGKLYLQGGGWDQVGPDPYPYWIAGIVHVSWDEANTPHDLRMELVDADGNAVVVDQLDGTTHPVVIEGKVEVGRPPGVKPGTALPVPLAIPVPPISLVPGQTHSWCIWIDGETREEWRLPFLNRPQAQAQAA